MIGRGCCLNFEDLPSPSRAYLCRTSTPGAFLWPLFPSCECQILITPCPPYCSQSTSNQAYLCTTHLGLNSHTKDHISILGHMAFLTQRRNAIDGTIRAPKLNFESLALELRNVIYQYALSRCGDDSIDLPSGPVDDLALGLLAVSSKIRLEAMPIFFGANTFRIDCTGIDRSQLEACIRKLPDSNLGMIRKFRFYHRHAEPGFSALDTPSGEPKLSRTRCRQGTFIDLHFLSRSPFYMIKQVPEHTSVEYNPFSAVVFFLKDLLVYRRIRRLAMVDLLDIACFVDRCGDLHARVLSQKRREQEFSPS